MFPARYYPNRYYAGRYFPHYGMVGIAFDFTRPRVVFESDKVIGFETYKELQFESDKTADLEQNETLIFENEKTVRIQ